MSGVCILYLLIWCNINHNFSELYSSGRDYYKGTAYQGRRILMETRNEVVSSLKYMTLMMLLVMQYGLEGLQRGLLKIVVCDSDCIL